MAYNQITSETRPDGIQLITINRPDKMNALNLETVTELTQAMEEMISNKDVYAAIITGAGEKAFVAGADISEFSNFTKEQAINMGANGHHLMDTIEGSPKPVLAAVNGFALGGGCELAIACHLRIASENARFGQPEVNLGIIPGYGGTQRLPRLIGHGKAMELIMTGDAIKAEEALLLGLVNYVCPPEELIEKSAELLAKIGTKGPLAIKKVIEAVNAAGSPQGPELEARLFASCFETDDVREGTRAFVEKRKPEFAGK